MILDNKRITVPAQRRWEKIARMESMIMAYHTMLETGNVPLTNEIINFQRSRWGEPIMDGEQTRAYHGMFSLKQDILKNLEEMELTEKDYIAQLKKKGLNDIIAVFSGIKDPKEVTKDAKA